MMMMTIIVFVEYNSSFQQPLVMTGQGANERNKLLCRTSGFGLVAIIMMA
jgi:hypothetical protein